MAPFLAGPDTRYKCALKDYCFSGHAHNAAVDVRNPSLVAA